jgi:hypothetical protein
MVMEILNFINGAQDFYLPSGRINRSVLGRISKYVPIDATNKTGKKTRCMVDFIFSMTLNMRLLFSCCA